MIYFLLLNNDSNLQFNTDDDDVDRGAKELLENNEEMNKMNK